MSIYDADYPRRIDMDMDKPPDADPAEWEAFVSWFNEDGCEYMIEAFSRLWEERGDYGFRFSEWKDIVAGLPETHYTSERLEQFRTWRREYGKLMAKLNAGRERQVDELRRIVFSEEKDSDQ